MSTPIEVRHCPSRECPYRATVGHAAEFTVGTLHCTDCGKALVDGPAPSEDDLPSPASMPADGRVETIAITRNQGVTFLIQGLLESAGIPSFVSGAESARAFGGLLRTRILVPSEQAERARELLRSDVDAEDFEPVPAKR